MPEATLLVIDDDIALLYSIRRSLSSEKLRVLSAHSAASGLSLFAQERPDVVLLDLKLHETSGLDVLRAIRAADLEIPVIMFTAYSTTTATIEATQEGAFEYLLKPVDLERLKETVERAISLRHRSIDVSSNGPDEVSLPLNDVTIIGSSPAMQSVYKQIGRFASSQGNVLILGESGTGKELVARAVHRHSARRDGQFVAINCAALSETLLESELFGHERGAFTGADKRRLGKFEYADGGTIFLDEVADMLPNTQAKVLRLLQEQRFERLGGNQTIKTHARIVAATNKNLEALVAQGRFREDLYYRLNVFSITLPPLRDRLEDLPDLISYFVGCFKAEFGKSRVQVDADVMRLLKSYPWPGNMRELQSVIRYGLAHALGGMIRPEHLPHNFFLVEPPSTSVGFSANETAPSISLHDLTQRLLAQGDRHIYDQATAHLDQIVLPLVLDRTRGNLQQACDLLGLSRNTLKAKMREYGITVEHAILSKIDRKHQSLSDPKG